ncbi:cobalamin-independent methionine synthase II family protein [Halalkalicoccus jeotgali]|uniref:Methionine synthase II (Cobalamin-independent)-like protein n=1 Tax=Halalkalicoccus jeotgali (strain DSM 18796 / CECT 7217 / JCM 14584 / KCTC 4019 / B3) TaxID=795797 RepID=D8J784_HALJB|nr:cobalamin-independent methionine synthase II family protein [Halalkalicoccus jeotgali]ADJ13979.1 Methionine synthase II (cobalamin-independent)- like protein [Halalkalicoccus jeotgali B3]ELY33976.1 methionine synthase II (cobalamin-independent)- like protein [Halalkalicoccus jeotgali B3]
MASHNRIRTTHIGSLPRPPELLDLLKARQDGEHVDQEQWDATVTDATRAVVERQNEVGLDLINNGEQSRVSFNWYVADRLSGIEGKREQALWADLQEFPDYAEETFKTDVIDLSMHPVVTGPVEYTGHEEAEDELAAFEDALSAVDTDAERAFVTAASPSVVTATHVDDYYGDYEEYLFAVAEAMAEEYELVAETGMTLQIDAPELLTVGHTAAYADEPLEEIKGATRLHVEALNEALSGIPEEQVRLHTCWGSYEGPHHLDTDLVEMLPEIYEADISGLSVEQANPRHQHEYRAFSDQPLPEGWTLLPGVVDVKTNVIDHPETIADRLERVVDAVDDATPLIAAPDCGFGTQAGIGMVDPEIAWAKLEALVEGASIVAERRS